MILMRKRMKYLSAFLLAIMILINCTSCNLFYKYTAEYLYNNYEIFDYNLVYLKYGDFIADDIYQPHVSFIEYFEIPGTSTEEFIVAYTSTGFIGAGIDIRVAKNKSYDIVPLRDLQIEKMELYWQQSANIYYDSGKEDASLHETQEIRKNYGTKIYGGTAATIDDEALKKDIVKYILENERKFDNTDKDAPVLENPYIEYSSVRDLTLRIYFSEHENLVWDSKILRGPDGNYYFSVNYNEADTGEYNDSAYTGFIWHTCVQVPEELQVLIEQLY